MKLIFCNTLQVGIEIVKGKACMVMSATDIDGEEAHIAVPLVGLPEALHVMADMYNQYKSLQN